MENVELTKVAILDTHKFVNTENRTQKYAKETKHKNLCSDNAINSREGDTAQTILDWF